MKGEGIIRSKRNTDIAPLQPEAHVGPGSYNTSASDHTPRFPSGRHCPTYNSPSVETWAFSAPCTASAAGTSPALPRPAPDNITLRCEGRLGERRTSSAPSGPLYQGYAIADRQTEGFWQKASRPPASSQVRLRSHPRDRTWNVQSRHVLRVPFQGNDETKTHHIEHGKLQPHFCWRLRPQSRS